MDRLLSAYMPINASEHGPYLDMINGVVHWLMLILFIGWGLYFIYVLYRFRSSRNPKASYHGAQTHLHSYAEVGVAIVEVILLVGFSIPAWSRWVRPPSPSQNPLIIRVVAEQFAWNIHYPGTDGVFGRTDAKLMSGSNPLGLDPNDPKAKDDVATINQLFLQVNRPVTIRLTSKDVIHSFNLPVMRVKQDAVPGIEIPVHFKPVKVNKGRKWEIGCAQLCGLAHYRMKGFLTVGTGQELQTFLAANAQPSS